MNEADTTQAPANSALSGRWQIPLLVIALGVFGVGMYRTAEGHQRVSFEEAMDRVDRLRSAGALERASAYLLHLLTKSDLPMAERGELHRQLAGVIHEAESRLVNHVPRNVEAMVEHYQDAMRCGIEMLPDDWVELGDAYQWRFDDEKAIEAYLAALQGEPRNKDRVRLKAASLLWHAGRHGPEAASLLDAMIADPDASPSSYQWAFEHKVEWLLDRGESRAAEALVEEAESRLAGTADRPCVDYARALVLEHEGRLEESGAVLRTLRNEWTVRDQLWGRAGWLLGRIEQQEDRPQSALAFFDEAVSCFQSGDLRAACILGRAESLASLERYESSLESFQTACELLKDRRLRGALDRPVVATALTMIGERLARQNRFELSLSFLGMGLELVDPNDDERRSFYLSRIAGVLERLGSTALDAKSAGVRAAGAERMSEAGEMYLALAELRTRDEAEAARSFTSSADCFEAAERIDRLTEVLERFVREHPAHEGRSSALFRLARAYQSINRFAEAVQIFDSILREYPRLTDAMASMVPRAECLLRMGGASARKGMESLEDIVDDRGTDPLFSPQALEYREALFLLVDFIAHADEKEIPGREERVIERIEDFCALYPEDVRIPQARFLLADAYRRSGQAVREEAAKRKEPDARSSAERESLRRIRRAMEEFDRVIGRLGAENASDLSGLERTYLKAAYLYRGDCLFDLDQRERAIEAYREAAWRYESLPTSVAASMQIIHCYLRSERPAEARAALMRLRWLLKKIPAASFDSELGMSPKAYWQGQVARLEQTLMD